MREIVYSYSSISKRDREESVENIRHLQIAQVQLQCGYHGISDGWRGLNEKVEVMEGRVGWDGRSWAFVRTRQLTRIELRRYTLSSTKS